MSQNGQGIMSDGDIKLLFDQGSILSAAGLRDGQLQPASIDLHLGAKAFRVQAGFLPGKNRTVKACLDDLLMHTLDLSQENVLERGGIYIIPLEEGMALPADVCAVANPKSSTGRLDIFTRVITDYGTAFDTVPHGYQGPLYLEVSPLTFSVIAHQGDRLSQMRFIKGKRQFVADETLRQLDEKEPFIYVGSEGASEPASIERGIWLSVDLQGEKEGDIVGYRARRHAPLIDLKQIGVYDPKRFWEPIHATAKGEMILNPEDFYILASRERLVVPPEFSVEMMPYETNAGELRVHYAGFFDPGFGYKPSAALKGTRGVLEVRSHDVPFVLEHGQKICRMVYEDLTNAPEQIYGESIGSNYANQGVSLAKHFKKDSA